MEFSRTGGLLPLLLPAALIALAALGAVIAVNVGRRRESPRDAITA